MIPELIEKGGFVMWPLILCSMIALAVILERVIVHQRVACSSVKLLKRIHAEGRTIHSGNVPGWLESASSLLEQLATIFFRYAAENAEVRNNALKRVGDNLLTSYNKHLKVISIIAHAAPLLGLLGTVTGLVAAFARIEELGGQVRPSDLAGGIWEALLTTVVGLSIGLVCYLVSHFFQSSSERMTHRMQELVSELNEMLLMTKPDDGSLSALVNESTSELSHTSQPNE